MPKEQNKDKWPPDGDRPRQWRAVFLGHPGAPDCGVIVRYHAILNPGEDLAEDPKTLELTWDEWVRDHDTVYGLALDGTERAEVDKDKEAWKAVKAAAKADPTGPWPALVRLLRPLLKNAD